MADDNSERGSIAILALWGVALIFMLIAPVAFATRGELQLARNALAESRARLAAEAGTQLGLQRLLQRHDSGNAVFDGTPEAWQQGSTRVAIRIADEAGKIDLNLAPAELLAGLFGAAGEPADVALLLACNVLNRRGDSTGSCPDNAVGSGQRFVAPEELAELPGISEPLYNRVADAVTVMSGASAIDPRAAPRLVLLAIPGATAGLVDSFLDGRATWRDLGSVDVGAMPAGIGPYVMISPRRDYTISAIAVTSDGARYRAELQVRLTARAAQPYQVLAWRTPPADRGATGPAKARQVP